MNAVMMVRSRKAILVILCVTFGVYITEVYPQQNCVTAKPCQTVSCEITFTNLLDSMNPAADPCTDFYEFVCGNRHTTAGSTSSSSSSRDFQSLERSAYESVRVALEAHSKRPTKSKAIRYLSALYRQLDSSLALTLHPTLLYLLLEKQIKLYDTLSLSASVGVDHSWTDLEVEAYLLGESPLIKSIHVLESDSVRGAVNAVIQLHADHTEPVPNVDRSVTGNRRLLKAIAEFRRRLVKIFATAQEQSPNTSHCPKAESKNVASVQLHNPRFQVWRVLLNSLAERTGASFRFTDHSRVTFSVDTKLVRLLTELLDATPHRTIRAWIGSKVLRKLGSDFAGLILKLDRSSLFSAFVKMSPHHSRHWNPVYFRLVADLIGRRRANAGRTYITELTRLYQWALVRSFQSPDDHRWMDQKTRRKAIQKVAQMQLSISHPDWIFDDHKLDRHCGFDDPTESAEIREDFAHSYLHLIRLANRRQFRSVIPNAALDQKVDYAGEHFHFPRSMASNVINYNLIAINFLSLIAPNFDVDHPAALKHGRVGSALGHELVHGFELSGRCFDATGAVGDWWSPNTAKAFRKRSHCLVRQFDRFVEPVTGARVNGARTLNENIADAGGLRLAYRVFLDDLAAIKDSDHCDSSLAWPEPLQQFTQEQLFFISYASGFCKQTHNSSWTREEFERGDHSPELFRVNQVLANFDRFGRAFRCPVDSEMNPVKRCVL